MQQSPLVSVAGLMRARVSNQSGQRVGAVVDLIARMQPEDDYPPLTGLLIRVGSRRSFLPADAIGEITRRAVRLRTARMDLHIFPGPGEVLLAEDVLDHQLIDLEGRQVLRAADLYLARMAASSGWWAWTSASRPWCVAWGRGSGGACRRRSESSTGRRWRRSAR